MPVATTNRETLGVAVVKPEVVALVVKCGAVRQHSKRIQNRFRLVANIGICGHACEAAASSLVFLVGQCAGNPFTLAAYHVKFEGVGRCAVPVRDKFSCRAVNRFPCCGAGRLAVGAVCCVVVLKHLQLTVNKSHAVAPLPHVAVEVVNSVELLVVGILHRASAGKDSSGSAVALILGRYAFLHGLSGVLAIVVITPRHPAVFLAP